MANDCLVTKLKGTVDNSDLLKVGEMRINCSTARCGGTTTQNMRRFFLASSSQNPITVTAEGRTFLYNDQPYTTYTGTGGGADVAFEFPDGEYNISIISKYNIMTLNNVGGAIPTVASKFFMIDVSSFDYSHIADMQTFMFYTFGEYKGDFSRTERFQPTWGSGGCTESHTTFDFSIFEGNTRLISLQCDSNMTKARGNINVIKSPNISNFTMVNPEVTGSLDQLLDDMVAAGRASGRATFLIYGGGITYNGEPITLQWITNHGATNPYNGFRVEFDPTYPNGYRLVFN